MKKDFERDKKCGSRLKSAMAECGVLAKDMARDLNYSTTYFSQLCNGKAPIDEEKAKKFADYLNQKDRLRTPYDDIIRFDDDTELVIKNNRYDYRYFMGEWDLPNVSAFIDRDAKSKFEIGIALSYGSKMLVLSGYEFSAKDSLFSALGEMAAHNNLSNNDEARKHYANKYTATLQQLSTGKEIVLSLSESASLLEILIRSISATLDSVFLAYRADDSSSENAPDLGKT
jgi:transcriptional regulator with XRE-family HTH domain